MNKQSQWKILLKMLAGAEVYNTTGIHSIHKEDLLECDWSLDKLIELHNKRTKANNNKE